MTTMPLTVKQAAIAVNGALWTLPRPKRHRSIMLMLYEHGYPKSFIHEKGFLLSDDSFVNRTEAGKIAINTGQCVKIKRHPLLHTSDLW